MGECTHDCSTCSEKCEHQVFTINTNEYSNIKKRIGIVSGKGGVGKSFVTGMMAVTACRNNMKTCILDGDILGPSIPKMFNMHEKAYGDKTGKFVLANPTKKLGIDIISSMMLIENEDDPIIWRGSMVTNLIKQFYSDVVYGNQDIMFIDMPPGTGDVVLTIFQSIPLDGIIIVTSPQDLVSTIVTKAIKMANMMNIPILGIVENYSYVECPKCKEKIDIYGKSSVDEIAAKYNIKNVIKLPLKKEFAMAVDNGNVEDLEFNFFDDIIKSI